MDRWTPGDSICVNGVLQLIENSFVNYIYYWYDIIWYDMNFIIYQIIGISLKQTAGDDQDRVTTFAILSLI